MEERPERDVVVERIVEILVEAGMTFSEILKLVEDDLPARLGQLKPFSGRSGQ